ncbi:ethanolamine/propanediol utilisation protein eutp/pduv [Lucifera butyrica]|uniref:Ethanolamine/propanediol utilisation protein eutp/pduv n=1 Tax=Lucifera butyrica TaxID=1351585 RepID=A0A498R529_9FIRM|nr:EutP/PduV family microcompartment system protein [Lucifera butyrica]VBB05293.1 ethanolamine/propanediol utilisation protein eutp/pduv [Lucifera butyrica]
MNKVMLIGPVGAGKTSLAAALAKNSRPVTKTQDISFADGAIDTPGEYAQIPRFYSALMVTAMSASLVIMVQDATEGKSTLPPAFAGMFARPVIGVVTKVDLPAADRERARACLEQAGAGKTVFFVSTVTGEGLNELMDYLQRGGACHE